MAPKEFKSEVLKEKELTHNVKYCRFSITEDFYFKPGQYVSLSVRIDDKKIRVPYSIASTPDKKYMELCVKKVENGKASHYVWNLKKGDKTEFFGPLGKFTINKNSQDKDLIFICTGTGISPFVSMIPWLLKERYNKKIILIKGFRKQRDVLYEKEFSDLRSEHDNFEFYNVLSSSHGYVQDTLGKYVPKNFKGHIYICGLSEMIDAVKEKLKKIGIEEDRVFFEKYD